MSDSRNTKSVLFVCLGNICRSPAAEGVFTSLVESKNLQEDFEIDSAGTAGYHIGNRADPRMRAAATQRGIDLQSRARKLIASDLDTFDLVVAMDRENFADIQRLQERPRATIKMLSDYLDNSWPTDVPDPYYGGDEGFEYVLDMLQAACPQILDELLMS